MKGKAKAKASAASLLGCLREPNQKILSAPPPNSSQRVLSVRAPDCPPEGALGEQSRDRIFGEGGSQKRSDGKI